MHILIKNLTLIAILAPLLGAVLAGLFGRKLGTKGAQWVTILGVGISFLCSALLFKYIAIDKQPTLNETLYTWAVSISYSFDVGFLVDQLTTVMMVTVTFVSLLVHIYSIGYMKGDPGYQRFFSYMSLFTFFMLILTVANNFLVLFFGWEGVGLVSYLLIGFWFKKESAVQGGLKAFLVNRVGDFGFLLGIAAIFDYFGTLDYATVFSLAPSFSASVVSVLPGVHWSLLTMVCILLFVGAMGKSAQVPLHIWLPESMEGPTPISALIHAATMVTAGVYMVARMSPLYDLSITALSVVLIFGAVGALFLGLLALVENDIKRVIAYSTMSQLGYMMAGNGASAYPAGIFHLITHAYFKALLFLAAGAVIVALHHEQNMRRMGNLRKYLPITYICFLIGALSLSAIPPFSGFYSKDAIIEAVSRATMIPGFHFAYICLLIGTFVTALYIFRAFFLTFHGKPAVSHEHVREPAWVMLIPLIVLAIPSVVLGAIMVYPMLYAKHSLLGNSIFVDANMDVLGQMAHDYRGYAGSIVESFFNFPFWFALAGVVCAWILYVQFPALPRLMQTKLGLIYRLLINKYGFDAFYQLIFVRGGQFLSNFLYREADLNLIDDKLVNGSGRGITFLSRVMRRMQSGYLYHYAFAMILGLCALLFWMLLI